jgi:hypothetical protein
MSAGLTRLIRPLALMMLIKNLGRHSNVRKERVIWSFHMLSIRWRSEWVCHIGQSGKNITNVQKIGQICSYISKVGIRRGDIGKGGK